MRVCVLFRQIGDIADKGDVEVHITDGVADRNRGCVIVEIDGGATYADIVDGKRVAEPVSFSAFCQPVQDAGEVVAVGYCAHKQKLWVFKQQFIHD